MDNLKKELNLAIEENWVASKRPILLSALGGRISEKARQERLISGKSLATIIREELTDVAHLLPAREHGGAVLPVSVINGRSDSELESLIPAPVRDGHVDQIARNPRIAQEVWRLFRDGIEEGKRAWVSPPKNGYAAVRQVGRQELPETGWFEVLPQDIATPVPGASQPDPASIGPAIRAWAARSGIPLSDLQTDPPARALGQAQAVSLSASQKIPSLVNALSILRQDELARISIPADIVLAVLRRFGAQ